MSLSMIRGLPVLLLGWGVLTACDQNPTVDPNAQLTAKGQALRADGTPLANVDVKMIRFFDENRIAALKIEPSVDDLFECEAARSCNVNELNLQVAHVMTGQTDASGNFELEFSGADIAVDGGVKDAMGNVEGSNLVIVIKDPDDANGRAGVSHQGPHLQRCRLQLGHRGASALAGRCSSQL